MKLELQNEIRDLLTIYKPEENQGFQNARFLGMAQAMLTDEQGEQMVSYLQKWIQEEK